MSSDSADDVVVDRAVLEAAGFGDGEDAFDEAAAAFALGAEGQFAVDHGRP